MKTKRYRWGWLIFWCLDAPEIAIVYLLIKGLNKR